MRCLSFPECATWCEERRISAPKDDYGYERPEIAEPDFHFVEIPYPVDSGKKVGLARRLYSLLPAEAEHLLWIRDWAIWPSSQHTPLFMRFREACGKRRHLIEAPGHLLHAGESDDAISVIAVSLLFFYDCFGISGSGRDAFIISHDEYCAFVTRDSSMAEKARLELKDDDS